MKFILGKKIGMSQIFDEKGNQVPVTLIETGVCEVLQIKTKEKDGYTAVQVGFEKIEKGKKIKKPLKHKPFKHLREFKDKTEKFQAGQKIDLSIFKEGDFVSISGISKGKGFTGGIKRWGFHGRPSTHGTKHEERTIGSTGSSTPRRVVKGRKMPGRAGGERVTIKKLQVVKVDLKNNILAVKGALPGPKGSLLEIKGL